MPGKKYYLSIAVAGCVILGAWGCRGTFPTPTLPAVPTPTPSANQTPVCGFAPVTMGNLLDSTIVGTPVVGLTPIPVSTISTPTVIRSLAEWQAYYSGNTVPTPPVDFASKMIIVCGLTTVCPLSTLSVASVCEGPTQITVSATETQNCILCNVATNYQTPVGVAVPQSNLPVVMYTTYVDPCGVSTLTPPATASQTPTATLTVLVTFTATQTATNTGTPTGNPTAPVTASPAVTATASPTFTPTVPVTQTFVPTATATPIETVPLPTPACAGATLMGVDTFGSVLPMFAGDIRYMEAGVPSSGKVSSLHFYSIVGATVVLGLYSDNGGQPGTLLSSTGGVNAAAGWNTASLNKPVNVSGGNSYWLGVYFNTLGDLGVVGSNSHLYQTGTSLPSSYGGGAVTINYELGIYADICPDVTVTPTAPVTQTVTVTPTAPVTQTVTDTWTPTDSPTAPITLTASPSATAPLTLTQTQTPVCTFTSVTLPNAGPMSLPFTPGASPVPTPSCWGPAAAASPVTTFNDGNGTLQMYAIQNTTDWQNFYGCVNPPPPPVDLASQMILVVEYQGCFESPSFLNVCQAQGQVTVTVQDSLPMAVCLSVTNPGDIVAVAAPQSGLPIHWQFNVVGTPVISPAITPTQTPTNTPSSTPFACAQTAVWGDSVAGSGGITMYTGNTTCQKYALAQNSNLHQIAFTVDVNGQSGVSMAAGIYSDGGSYPATLIWSSPFQSVATGPVVIPAPLVPLAAGNYWLALSTNLTVYLTPASGSSSTRTWETAVFPDPYLNTGGPLPTPIATPPPTSNTSIAVMYTDICY